MANFKIKILLLSLILVVSVACSVAPIKSRSVESEEKLLAAAQVYKRSVAAVPEDKINTNTCASYVTTMKLRWDWRAAVVSGNSCIRNHDLTRAEEIGNELSVKEPSAPWGPYFLASVARDRHEFERALWMSELALKRAPEIGIIYYLKGQILWSKKEFSPAIFCFEKSTELDKELIPAHLFLGRIYFRDQSYAKASEHFYAVLKIEPNHPVALSGLAESQLRDKNPQGALENYQRLADLFPKDGLFLSRMAEIYEQNLDDPTQALATYRLLQVRIHSHEIQLNIDLQIEAKIRELELSTHKPRTLASTEEKGVLVR